jgi:putative tryptophan/tyrosine transport system substrate-binding protein
MRRRDFLGALSSAAAWPIAARAQQGERVRRIGVLMNTAESNPEGQARIAALLRHLQQLGWYDGRNVRIDIRWGAGNSELYRKYAAELVALAADVVLGAGGPITQAFQQATRTVPILFTIIPDAVSAGYVESLARPGGNTTGFVQLEYSICSKWLELLKQVAPNVARVAVLRDAGTADGAGQFDAMQSAAPSLGVELIPVNSINVTEIERGVADLAPPGNGGLVVTAGRALNHRELIIALAARHRLPAVYPIRIYASDGGLLSYGADLIDQFRRVADYVDRILKGEKPADLPVQAPTKYELVINLKTAKALGINVPLPLLGRADEVIE